MAARHAAAARADCGVASQASTTNNDSRRCILTPGSVRSQMSWSREQALIVDSDPQTRAMAAAILAAEGYDCQERNDLGSARQVLKSMDRGLVVTELELPGGSGTELLPAARR